MSEILSTIFFFLFFGGIVAWTLYNSIRELLKTRNNKRANQDIQPLLGVVFPQETNKKTDKDKK